ncbi:MAG TPA: bifunctional DNA-formamidopyrimidine glycosylase/DNA-(apurinic or apyrimidinic site) lyase [Candidatus Binatia bacterium]|nr:bifunctional DNA-formamidopyrimidine glycosylase/DNA-(apurinic or apyrimidinic site) lyase [Candidatus Binatia bacterium]
MPELPEVETIARGLGRALRGRRVVAVEVREARLRAPVSPGFAARLTGRRIEAVFRRGKYLLAALDDGALWLIHLGMSGRITLAAAAAPQRRHDHVVVALDDARVLTYHDPRRFGRMDVIPAAALAAETGGGIDALAPELTPGALFALTRRRRTSTKALLMDQRRVAGLGNIYVNELLFRAGVRPRRRAGRLTRAQCARIVAATRAVLAEAIRHGGSSISDYRDGFGRAGRFQAAHRVYGRAGEPCSRCRTPLRACRVAGRSSFYCPRCQS